MITVDLNGERVTIRPRSLHSYIEKSDYIKSRRPSPYVSLRDLPKQKSQASTDRYLELAVMASMRMSSVGFEEEMDFDGSLEGVYYAIWQALKGHFKWSEDGHEGVDKAEKWYTELSADSKIKVLSAIRGTDERKIAKNSAGPAENPPKGPEEQLVQAEISQASVPQTAT